MEFQEYCRRFFGGYFALYPHAAIHYGIDGYDALLPNFDDTAFEAEKAFWHDAAANLRRVQPALLSPDEQIDYKLLQGRIAVENYELQKNDYRLREPWQYIRIGDIYYLTIFPTNNLRMNLVFRLLGFSAVLKEGIKNLSRPGANPPRLWTEMAVQEAEGGLIFLDQLLTIPKVKEVCRVRPEVVESAVVAARDTLSDFREFLVREVLYKSNGKYAVGEEHFNLILAREHFLSLDAVGLLALGENLVAQVRQELQIAADKIAPGMGIQYVAEKIQGDHPSASELIAAYQSAMERARQFVEKNELVSFPPVEQLLVVPTPEFSRHEIPFAAYLAPPLSSQDQMGWYYVTPSTDDDSLREHNYTAVDCTSVHEGYPGHHLQFAVRNHIPAARTFPRILCESSVFYEGWAVYCEQLMIEQGFLKKPEHRFVMFKDRLWRTMRIIIDVKTHTGKMSYDDAAALMMRELFFSEAQAHADLNWYSQAPAIPMGYATGWAMINELRRQEQRKQGSRFSLRKFHDKFLSAGSIAVPLILKRHFS